MYIPTYLGTLLICALINLIVIEKIVKYNVTKFMQFS